MELNQGQRKVVRAVVRGENVFMTGDAGTGKSVAVEHCMEAFKAHNKEVLLCAPTGIAAQQIGGATIHRTFGFSLAPKVADEIENLKVPKVVRQADTIIIDEIGMVRRDLMDAIVRVIELENDHRKGKRSPIQLVVVGDFAQLPPVVTQQDQDVLVVQYGEQSRRSGYYAFEADGWTRMGFKSYQLTEPMRQSDREFLGKLSLARMGNSACIDFFNRFVREAPGDAVAIVPTNREAEELNNKRLEQLTHKKLVYRGQLTGVFEKRDMAAPLELTLARGARVIILTNNTARGYVNGLTGIVREVRKDEVEVLLDKGGVVKVIPFTWENIEYEVVETKGKKKLNQKVVGTYTQIPLKLAWAITYHKSQGQTLSSINIRPDVFASGMLYVGLSRVTAPEGLYLTNNIVSKRLKADKAVVNFYREVAQLQLAEALRSQSEDDDGAIGSWN
ncbi:MAG: AAA family ATPase [Atopobiaceae bacterium]|nr:AAA family ATPase [Atopobiaceae bacterium]